METVIYDIESSPNIGTFWRPGYKIRISHDNIIQERKVICICWTTVGSDEVYYLNWDQDQNDKDMLEEFADVLNNCDIAVAHNGDRFDLPWLKGRLCKLEIPVDPWLKTIDTLKWAKKMGFNSNRLDYLGQYLLGYGKTETSYGMWKDILLNNDRDVLQEMVDYCINDVVLLEEVYERLAPFNRPNFNKATLTGGEKWMCPYTGSADVHSKGKRTTAAGTVQWRMWSNTANRYYQISNKSHQEYKEQL